MPPSSEPLIIIQSQSNSSHNAFATVVLPMPGVPENNRLDNSPLVIKDLNSVFNDVGNIQSSILPGLYCSTHKKSVFIFHSVHIII